MKMTLEDKKVIGQCLWDFMMLKDCPAHFDFARQFPNWQLFEYKPTSEKVLIVNTATDKHGEDTCIMLALKKHNPEKTYVNNGNGHKVHGVRADELLKLKDVDEPKLDSFIEFAEKKFNCRETATSGKEYLKHVNEAASLYLEGYKSVEVAKSYHEMTPKQKRQARKKRRKSRLTGNDNR